MNTIVDANGIVDVFSTSEDHDRFHDQFVTRQPGESTPDRPHSQLLAPIFEILGDRSSPLVAAITTAVAFDVYMADLLPEGVNGIIAVLTNTCGDFATYEITGRTALYLGSGDYHDSKYDDKRVEVPFDAFSGVEELARATPGHCIYSVWLYPSDRFANSYRTPLPVTFASVVGGAFLLMICTFLVYDRFVDYRNNKVVHVAARSNVIVSNLFPTAVREKLFEHEAMENREPGRSKTSSRTVKNFLRESEKGAEQIDGDRLSAHPYKSKPIAELFPDTTVLFADIAGRWYFCFLPKIKDS